MANPQRAPDAGACQNGGKYERILAAALTMFSRKGFHETKVSEIAREAGVADGTIYLYFKNKDDLLISLFEAKLDWINSSVRDELAQVSDPFAKLERYILFHLQLAQDNPTLAAFITVELRRSSTFIKEYAKERLMEYLGQLGAVIDAGKTAGVFRSEISTGILKHSIFGALDQACMIWSNNPHRRREDLDEVGSQLVDFVRRAVQVES